MPNDNSGALIVIKEEHEEDEAVPQKKEEGFAFAYDPNESTSVAEQNPQVDDSNPNHEPDIEVEDESAEISCSDSNAASQMRDGNKAHDNLTVSMSASVKSTHFNFKAKEANLGKITEMFKMNTPLDTKSNQAYDKFAMDDLLQELKKHSQLEKLSAQSNKMKSVLPKNTNNLFTPE